MVASSGVSPPTSTVSDGVTVMSASLDWMATMPATTSAVSCSAAATASATASAAQ